MQVLKFFIFSILFFLLGVFASWLYFHSPENKNLYNKNDLLELLRTASTEMPEEVFSCKTKEKTISAILVEKGFLSINSTKVSNTQFSCDNSECSLMTTDCTPWQTRECGQTFLRYKIDPNRKIIDSSFECIEVP